MALGQICKVSNLGYISYPQALDPLTGDLKDANRSVRGEAASALG